MSIGLQVASLRAELDADALAGQAVKLRVDQILLRVGGAILTRRQIPNTPITLLGLQNGMLALEVAAGFVRAEVEMRLQATTVGRLRLEPATVKANGVSLPPVLVGVAIGVLRKKAAGKPGVHLAPGNVIEIDLREVIAGKGIDWPVLRTVRITNEAVELEYQR